MATMATTATRRTLSIWPVTASEILIIFAAFFGRFTLQLFQTTIGTEAPVAYHMNNLLTGVAFAVFSLAFGVAALIMHYIRPSRLRAAEIVALIVLALLMPLFALVHTTAVVFVLMAAAGLVTGVVMDAFMTMAGMTHREAAIRQKDQAAFSFWVSLALVISPFVTGSIFAAVHPVDLFLWFAVMPLVSLIFVLALTGPHRLQYTEDVHEQGSSFSALLAQPEYRMVLFAALSYTLPLYVALNFGYRLGTRVGLSAQAVFYLFAGMFLVDVVTRLYIRAISPIRVRAPYFAAAVLAGWLAAVALLFVGNSAAALYVGFPLVGLADGIVWTLGLQTANQVFNKRDIATATSYFSSAMMVTAALMPAVGALFAPIGLVGTLALAAAVTTLLALPVFRNPAMRAA
jgi:MFS family permease